jgi:Zn-dependent protease with chaperone function
MPFLLLLVLSFSCLPVSWPRPPQWIGALGQALLSICGIQTSLSGDLVGSVFLTWAGVVVVMVVAWLGARGVRRKLRLQPNRRDFLTTRQSKFRFYHFIGVLAFYGSALYLLGWGWVVQGASAGPSGDPYPFPGSELLVAAPLFAALIGSWAGFYGAERALHDAGDTSGAGTYWTRWSYVAFHLRHNLALVFAPLLLLIILSNVIRMLPQQEVAADVPVAASASASRTEGLRSEFDAVKQNLPYLGGALAVILTMPWIFRLVLGLKRMPPGDLRTRLLATCRRLRFRCSGILIWNTRGGIVNAMVIGLVPFIRYVVLTDRLVAELTPDEVEAVFGHEVGHIKHRHMWYYFGFLLISLAVLTQAAAQMWEVMKPDPPPESAVATQDAAPLPSNAGLPPGSEIQRDPPVESASFNFYARQDLALIPLVAAIGAYVFVVFGFLSRRCERQADIYGCRTVSCGRRECCGHDSGVELLPSARGLCRTGIHTFINALEKVAYLNGISRDRPGWLQSWQHSTIARRVDFLHRALEDPTVEPRFQRRIGLVKWGLLIVLSSALVLIGIRGWVD